MTTIKGLFYFFSKINVNIIPKNLHNVKKHLLLVSMLLKNKTKKSFFINSNTFLT